MATPPSFYFPGEDFFLTRSYVDGLNVRLDGAPAYFVDNLLYFTIAGPPDALHRVTIEPKFIPWSSNHFRLGDIFLSCEFKFPLTDWIPLAAWDVGYLIPTGATRGSIHINVHYGAENVTTPLPYSPPGDYWLPEPLT